MSSYLTEETSRQDGSPIELYDLVLGSDQWHFCSCADPVTFEGTDYTPVAVVRDSLPLGSDERRDEFSVTMPSDHAFVQKYIHLVPAPKATITVRRVHRFDDSEEVMAFFKGTVAAIRYIQNGTVAAVGVAPITDRLSLTVPRFVFSALCNHVLGDRWCDVDLVSGSDPDGNAYTFVGNCSSVLGATVIVDGIAAAGYPNQFFKNGKITTASADTRLITSQVGDTLTVLVPLFEGSALETHDVTVVAGCDHSLPTCIAKFDNRDNNGGFPFIPRLNIFKEGMV